MSSVSIASGYARRLVEAEAKRQRVSVKQAIPAVARHIKVPVGCVWGLLFRVPKQVSFDLFASLEEAVARDLRKQIGALENELVSITSRPGRALTPSAVSEIEADLARLRAAVGGRKQ
jgi:hypothetical protein